MKLKHAYVTSDHHFGHDRVARLRGFESASDFAKAYIEAHNAVVQDHHAVVFLGDVCMSRESLAIISQLKGSKKLVLGNHDQFSHQEYLEAGFLSTEAMRYSGDLGVVLTHYPVHSSYFTHRQATWINLHGHLHQEVIPDPRYINACIEQSLAPRLISELIK
jgi:calcineurin-like phosphoesterase family protein